MRIDAHPVLTETHRQLINELREGHSRSGNELARQCGISRAGVWKAVRYLKSLGMEIHAVPGVGYRLEHPLELLEAEAIERCLSSAAARWLRGVHIHDVLESTNTFLRDAARAGAPSGTLCLAEAQTMGRGRLGRSWLSPFAGNIYLSLLWHFSSPAVLGGLSLAVGVLLVRALRAAGADGVALKWPNDILWNERKLGGILIEISGEIHGQCAVVIGVGINCFFPRQYAAAIDPPAVDLRQIIAAPAPSRNGLVAAILNQLLPALADYEAQGFEAYLDEWRRYHVFEGRAVTLDRDGNVIEGRIVGVTRTGTLLLECNDGTRREFSSGDVRVRAARS